MITAIRKHKVQDQTTKRFEEVSTFVNVLGFVYDTEYNTPVAIISTPGQPLDYCRVEELTESLDGTSGQTQEAPQGPDSGGDVSTGDQVPRDGEINGNSPGVTGQVPAKS